ncbi:hypothetical protein [Octadecabacter sp. R77987]|uniref:hypothetical protein n=1 Tax=Octadecabacter sp. R77987 TaxID=3093874 RepID=UPI00366AFD67
MLAIFHYLHLSIAVIWAGSTVFVGLAVWPMLARLPGDQAVALFDRLRPVVAGVLGSMAGLTYLLGGFRAWLGGGISGWADLLAPYGVLVITAFVVMMAIENVGGRLRRQFSGLTDRPDAFVAHATIAARRAGLIQLGLLLVMIAIMVTMGLALY